MFPFIFNDTILYFASDAWTGLGGFDIYESIYDGDHWSEPRNLGYPVNTPRDDFGFILDSAQQHGFFTSNRIGLTDRIFQFTKNPPQLRVEGVVTDLTGKPLPHISMVLKVNGKTEETVATTEDGKYKFPLKPGINYTVIARNSNYFGKASEVSTIGKRYSEDFTLNFELDKVQSNLTLSWTGIYFPKKTLAITDETLKEIDKLAAWLILNPNLQIEIHSHTDARGSDAENLALSQKRAEAVMKALISNKEIASSRIRIRGFGESRLLNNCVDGILCLEEDHRVNNRIEIKVTGILP
jgi:outer membrane protein OmpA-like peptidoglycan-associated protein